MLLEHFLFKCFNLVFQTLWLITMNIQKGLLFGLLPYMQSDTYPITVVSGIKYHSKKLYKKPEI